MEPARVAKVKNAFKGKGYSFFLENVNINGLNHGCSGFIKNGDKCVYINTELPIMFRYAKDEKDFQGETNQYCWNFEEFVKNVDRMLKEK